MEYRNAARQAQTLPELLQMLREAEAAEAEKRAAVEEYLRIKAWRAGLPRYGKFELTPLCNLDCKMCYIHLQKEQMHGKELLPVEAADDPGGPGRHAGGNPHRRRVPDLPRL